MTGITGNENGGNTTTIVSSARPHGFTNMEQLSSAVRGINIVQQDEDTSTTTTCTDSCSSGRSSSIFMTQNDSSLTLSNRSVRFDTIEIRDYPMELDGSGGVPTMSGAPLGISWDWISNRTIPVDKFESERDIDSGKSPRRPHAKLMALSSTKRTTILLDQGFKMQEIISASSHCDKIRKKRSSIPTSTTSTTPSSNKSRNLWSKARKGIKKIAGSRSSSVDV